MNWLVTHTNSTATLLQVGESYLLSTTELLLDMDGKLTASKLQVGILLTTTFNHVWQPMAGNGLPKQFFAIHRQLQHTAYYYERCCHLLKSYPNTIRNTLCCH